MGLRLSLLALAVSCLAGCAESPAPPVAPARPSARLPEIAVLGLDRQSTSLPAVTRGQPALVVLWATWCKSCTSELAELDRLHARVRGRALVLGVAVGEPYETVRDFVAPRDLHYGQFVDEEFRLADALGSERVPSTLVVDRDGSLRYRGGALDGKALAALREAMSE